MHKFSQFDSQLNIERLPLAYSLGDISSIREIFTPESGDIGRTQLPIFPPIAEAIPQDGGERKGYLVEASPSLVVAIKEFLQALIPHLEHQQESKHHKNAIADNYAEARRNCMNRVGVRLLEVIKQDRRLGLYNLFWLVISKHLVSVCESLMTGNRAANMQQKIAMQPHITKMFQETIQQVKLYLRKEDQQKHRYSKYINDTLTFHLGATFNHEFSRSVIADQGHLLFPNILKGNVLECSQAIFQDNNEKYHLTYPEFVQLYSGIRSYMEHRLQKGDRPFRELIANVLRVPSESLENVPLEAIVLHPTITTFFAEEFKHLPIKGSAQKKTLFNRRAPELSSLFDDGTWEFVMNDYVAFARDVRRSEVIAFLREHIAFVRNTQATQTAVSIRKTQGASNLPENGGVADRMSYRFEKGRILNDLRNVSLIFLDLRGFTELSAGDITDRELKEQIYMFFDPVVNIINHFGGVIKTYAGDGILASFGTPQYHALNAVRAAIEIQKFFIILKQEGKMAFHGMGIGIHTGLVEETYLFADADAAGYNTVIGLNANLVGRLSSGKAEKKRTLDNQAITVLNDYVRLHVNDIEADASSLLLLQDQLVKVVDAIHNEQASLHKQTSPQQHLTVNVTGGILNNTGIAISHTTFKQIGSLKNLQEQTSKDGIRFIVFDDKLQEQIVFIKAGDAAFKGIQGKFPVWGVYLQREI